MKIGFNFFLCIEDILEGKVKIDDVLYIISSTAIKEERNIDSVVLNHLGPKPDTIYTIRFIETVRHLYKEHKILQPRLQGIMKHNIPDYHWGDLFINKDKGNRTVKKAWENYKIASVLSRDHA